MEATTRLLLPASRIGGVIGACALHWIEVDGCVLNERGRLACIRPPHLTLPLRPTPSHPPQPHTTNLEGRGGDVIKGIRELTGARINISANPGSGEGEEDRDPHYRLVRFFLCVGVGVCGGWRAWMGLIDIDRPTRTRPSTKL